MPRRKRKWSRPTRPPLRYGQILAWADAHHARTSRWPGQKSGPVVDARGETWVAVSSAMYVGLRGLRRGYTLADLLSERRGVRNRARLPRYTERLILSWADDHFRRTGRWPGKGSGAIPAAPGETWAMVDNALYMGIRGMGGGSSLVRLLARQRGMRNLRDLPPLTIPKILGWADEHHVRTGRWPSVRSGPIAQDPGETWAAVGRDLTVGCRGLPGGSSLAQLLAEQRGVRNHLRLPRLSVAQILGWADEHHRRTGKWPRRGERIAGAAGDTWNAVELALHRGSRGLPGGDSLARLLARRRGVRNFRELPPFTEAQILSWADAHHRRTGVWPRHVSGSIREAAGETWHAVNSALRAGLRGMRGGSSLARLLAKYRAVPNIQGLPRLRIKQILGWADSHHRQTGQWPSRRSGPVTNAAGEDWRKIDHALQAGQRGLPGGSSLAKLLVEQRNVRNRQYLPRLARDQILAWADSHHAQTGEWPRVQSGRIRGAPDETWSGIESALQQGARGWTGGYSLAQLLAKHRGVRNYKRLPPLTEKQILRWADARRRRTGRWPNADSGPVADSGGETWHGIESALRQSRRGLEPGSLARLLERHRGVRNVHHLPRLTKAQILRWADAHRRRTGQWATRESGPVFESPEERWSNIDAALHQGLRGLPGGPKASSLARLLARYRGRPNDKQLPPLNKRQILAWADHHFRRTGQWPTGESGRVHRVRGQTWPAIDGALRQGHRGLPGGDSLARLLAKERGARNRSDLPRLAEQQILAWLKAHRARTGRWPSRNSGPILEAKAPGETWAAVAVALNRGGRGLPRRSSLRRLIGTIAR